MRQQRLRATTVRSAAGLLGATAFALALAAHQSAPAATTGMRVQAAQVIEPAAVRPNIVFVLIDDAGFSDFGSYGSEISTPNIDDLAKTGVRFTSFHTASTCEASRVMSQSGVDNHLAGAGTLQVASADNQRGKPGYEGHLSDNVHSLGQLLEGKTSGVHDPKEAIGFESTGGFALFKGDHKLVRDAPPYGDNTWRLFNLRRDPNESDNIAASEPALLKDMLAEVGKYIAVNGVVLPDPGYNGPVQVLKNNWAILVRQMWPVITVIAVVLALLVYGAVRIVRRGRSQACA